MSGYPLAAPISTPASAVPPRNNRAGLIAALVLALLLVLGLGVWGGMHLGAGHAASASPSAPNPAVAQALSPAPAAPQVAAPPAPEQAPASAVARIDPAKAPAAPEEAAPARRPEHRKKPMVKHVVPAAAVTAPVPSSSLTPATVSAALATPPAPPPLLASAKISGAGFWKRVVVENQGESRWHNCELRLPDNRHAFIDKLGAHDSESINMMKFKQDGPKRDADLDWVNVHCEEGSARVKFAE